MDIILWRHAEAEDFNPNESGDLARRLTAKGRGQAQAMAKWLRRQMPAQIDIKVSPARRCIETADALGNHYELCNDLAPGLDVPNYLEVIEAAHRAKHHGILLVGHQPTLGFLAATLMTGRSAPWGIKKAAVWWLRRENPQTSGHELVVALGPKFL